MLKKAAAATAIAASLMIIGSPAFAVTDGPELDITDQVGLVNLEDTDVADQINACFIDVNVIAVPVLSQNDSGLCANPEEDE